MQLKLISDVHLEHHKDNGAEFLDYLTQHPADVLVIAGDFVPLTPAFQTVRETALSRLCDRYSAVVYVPGNHEYYGGSIYTAARFAKSPFIKQHPTLHFLDNTATTINGITFAGTTLWFPDHPMNDLYASEWGDFKAITGFRDWVYDTNRHATWFLSHANADVWVTHHAPTIKSQDPRYRGSSYDRFVRTELTELILEKQPKLCVHGHIHWSFDYRIDQTRVVTNPHGYPHDLNRSFDDAMLIDLLPAPV